MKLWFAFCTALLARLPAVFVTVHLGAGIIKVKACSCGGGNAQLFHQGLVAMMPATQGHAALIRNRYYIVRVHVLQ